MNDDSSTTDDSASDNHQLNNVPETNRSAVDRRRVLASVGAAGTMMASTGIASADSPEIDEARMEEIRAPYRDIETVRSVMRERRELLEAVAGAGYIEAASVDALGMETLGEPVSPTDAQVDVGVSTNTAEPDADIRVIRESEAGRLHVSVKPELDRAFAAFEPADGDSFERVYSANICDCDSNEKCVRDCTVCNKMTCTCITDTGRLGKPNYRCECTENCGGW